MSVLASAAALMSNALLVVALWIAFAFTGYRISVRHRVQRGVTPWGFPSIVWALICLAIGPLGILVEFFAGVTTRPATNPPAAAPVAQVVTQPLVDSGTGRDLTELESDPASQIPGRALSPPKQADGTTAAFGWYADVAKRHHYRYFDGKYWSDQVADEGVVTTDPL